MFLRLSQFVSENTYFDDSSCSYERRSKSWRLSQKELQPDRTSREHFAVRQIQGLDLREENYL